MVHATQPALPVANSYAALGTTRRRLAVALFGCLTSFARADADLPPEISIDATSVPTALIAAVQPYCLDGNQGGFSLARSAWTFHKAPLGGGALLYFVQCRAAASNDLHAVLVQTAPEVIELQTFGARVHAIANVRWIAAEQTIVDISGSGAGCTHQRRWKWNGRRFVSAGRSPIGCAGALERRR